MKINLRALQETEYFDNQLYKSPIGYELKTFFFGGGSEALYIFLHSTYTQVTKQLIRSMHFLIIMFVESATLII